MAIQIEDLRLKIEETADYLYQENREKAYAGLNNIIMELGQLLNTKEYQMHNDLMEAVSCALVAVENEEMTLLADFLLYEISPRLAG